MAGNVKKIHTLSAPTRNSNNTIMNFCEIEPEVLSSRTGSVKFEWMGSNEAASYLRISVKTLMNLSSGGSVPFYKFGRRNRYRKDELDQILLQNKRGK